ncbi:MAG: nickel-responsive transcriptional regulator NikR [Candidatus Hadarchaeales archaeon]
MEIERISLTIEKDLLKELDAFIRASHYSSRSEAIRDALREFLAERKMRAALSGEQLGVLVMIYDHDQTGLSEKLLDIQHEAGEILSTSIHWHLDRRNCLEAMVVRGEAEKIKNLVENLEALRGVRQVKLIPIKK